MTAAFAAGAAAVAAPKASVVVQCARVQVLQVPLYFCVHVANHLLDVLFDAVGDYQVTYADGEAIVVHVRCHHSAHIINEVACHNWSTVLESHVDEAL